MLQLSPYAICNILRQYLARIARRYVLPHGAKNDVEARRSCGYRGQKKNDEQTRRKGLSLCDQRLVDHRDHRSVFGLFDPRHLILLRQQFENGFLNAHATVEVSVGNREPW